MAKKASPRQIITRCLNCGRVLTNEKGERLEDGVFDSSLPVRPTDETTTWARCEKCHRAAYLARL